MHVKEAFLFSAADNVAFGNLCDNVVDTAQTQCSLRLCEMINSY